MQKNFGQNDPQVAEYVDKLLHPEDEVLKEIRLRTERSGLPLIQVGPMDALHLEVLTRAANVEKAVEIGALAGYSSVAIARGLMPGGRLYTFELQETNARIANESYQKAGVADRIELFQGPALRNLSKIESLGPFDLVFIDADKISYSEYLKWAYKNLRNGGMLLADNTFGWGKVVDNSGVDLDEELAIKGLRDFNATIAKPDSGFRVTMLPTGEGLTLAVKL